MTRELEQAFSKNQLQKTGKIYTFDNERQDAYKTPFSAREHAEYEHKDKRYIRVEARPYDRESTLSNGEKPEKGKIYWVEVQPIEWFVEPDKITSYGRTTDNPNKGMMVAMQALFAGVQFDRNPEYDRNFEETDMATYLNDFFWKEMQPSKAAAVETAEKTSEPPTVSGIPADYATAEGKLTQPWHLVDPTAGASRRQ